MRIYISGAMTGISDYAERFERAEAYLRDGYGPEAEIINPARVLAPLPETTTWGQYMDIALNALRGCDMIYILMGWECSIGAQIERLYAAGCRMEVEYQVWKPSEKKQ